MDSQPDGMEPPLKKRKEEHLQLQETVTNIFTGEKLHCLDQPLTRECGFSSGYRGFWMGKEVGVRRVRVDDCHENWLNLIGKHQDGSLSHDNVLKVIGYEDDRLGQWR